MKKTWKIGNTEIQGQTVLAPLAGVGDAPFRVICREYGCGLIYTEFISAQGLLHKNKKTFKMIELDKREHPVGIQLFGSDPTHLAEASKFIEDTGADFVDLNCGCPERKIVSNGSGAALLKNPDLIAQIIEAMVRAVSIPVTLKIRIGYKKGNPVYKEVSKLAQDAGAKAVSINCCYYGVRPNEGFDWSVVADLKEILDIPVIGNGGIKTGADAKKVLEYGADAVMIGRACLGKPWVYRELNAAIEGEEQPQPVTLEERFNVMLRHLEDTVTLKGEDVGVAEMRKHWAWYVKGLPGASTFRGNAVKAKTLSEMIDYLGEFREYLEGRKKVFDEEY